MKRVSSLIAVVIVTFFTLSVARAESGVPAKAVEDVIGHICSDGGQWLKCYSIEPSKCHEVASGFVKPCVERVFTERNRAAQQPLVIDSLKELLGCFDRVFMARYGTGKLNTPECNQQPQHLR